MFLAASGPQDFIIQQAHTPGNISSAGTWLFQLKQARLLSVCFINDCALSSHSCPMCAVKNMQLVAVALLAMAFQLDLVRRVCKQRMSCFSVFLALPSATLRTMATAPCQVGMWSLY